MGVLWQVFHQPKNGTAQSSGQALGMKAVLDAAGHCVSLMVAIAAIEQASIFGTEASSAAQVRSAVPCPTHN